MIRPLDLVLRDPSGPYIRPVLYIAIGGTGRQVLERLRRRMLQNLWRGRALPRMEAFPLVSFLCLDFYHGLLEAQDPARADDTFSAMARLPLADYIVHEPLQFDFDRSSETRKPHPYIDSWLACFHAPVIVERRARRKLAVGCARSEKPCKSVSANFKVRR